jgi:hypothetical protein
MPLVSVTPPVTPTAPWKVTFSPERDDVVGRLKLMGAPVEGIVPPDTGSINRNGAFSTVPNERGKGLEVWGQAGA